MATNYNHGPIEKKIPIIPSHYLTQKIVSPILIITIYNLYMFITSSTNKHDHWSAQYWSAKKPNTGQQDAQPNQLLG